MEVYLLLNTRTVNFSLPLLVARTMRPAHSLNFDKGYRKFPKATDKMCGRYILYERSYVISSRRRKMFEAVAKKENKF
jgi:hypothetical protein